MMDTTYNAANTPGYFGITGPDHYLFNCVFLHEVGHSVLSLVDEHDQWHPSEEDQADLYRDTVLHEIGLPPPARGDRLGLLPTKLS